MTGFPPGLLTPRFTNDAHGAPTRAKRADERER
jgi:hypothetical protein